MNILIIGQGGREHAMATKILESPLCDKLFIVPGNGGTAQICQNLLINANDFGEIKSVVLENSIDLVIVGPEDPLEKGIVDFFKNDTQLENVKIFGPNKACAQLESSKAFAKRFMIDGEIPTAIYRSFTKGELKEMEAYIQSHNYPLVVKADGLAAGKGVTICDSQEMALKEIIEIFEGKFGQSNTDVVIEEFLDGIEISIFCAIHLDKYFILPEAKDYKRIFEHDQGPNTGGMGAVSPVSFYNEELQKKVESKIINKTLAQLRNQGLQYTGFLFFGIMIVDGEPNVIEYNVRMGDPESEVVFPRIQSDIVKLICDLMEQKKVGKLEIEEGQRVGFYLVSEGYPDHYEKGYPLNISGLSANSLIFHGATTVDINEQLITNGGRVIFISGHGENILTARQNALVDIEKVSFKNKFFRNDIGLDILNIS